MIKLSITVIVLLLVLFIFVVICACREHSSVQHKPWYSFFFQESWDDLRFMLKPKEETKIYKNKTHQQIGIYFIEIVTICGILIILLQWLSPVQSIGSQFWFDQFIRALTVYTAYQILVYSVLNIQASTKADQWLAVERIAKYEALYLKTSNESLKASLKEKLETLIKDFLDPYTFSTKESRELVNELKSLINETEIWSALERIDVIKIKAEHYKQESQLTWHCSLLLNKMK